MINPSEVNEQMQKLVEKGKKPKMLVTSNNDAEWGLSVAQEFGLFHAVDDSYVSGKWKLE